MSILSIYSFVFCSVGLLAYIGSPLILDKLRTWQEAKIKNSISKSEEIITEKKKKLRLFIISAIILGLLGGLIVQKPLGVVVGLIISIIVPSLIMKFKKARRDKKFAQQLVDGLMILSSSLRGGLSFIQSLEILCEEMPPPISEEFSLVIRETKMGVSIEETLGNLNKRMPSEELELFISSVLVARETGGDLTKVFYRLITTIRERTKLKDTIATYTLQGKIQGIIMSILPIAFFLWVQRFNPHHFDIMLQENFGRALLAAAVFLEIIALFLIKKFSTIKI